MVLMPASNARRVRRLAFSNMSTICLASRPLRYSRGLRLTSCPSFMMARTSALERSAIEQRSSPAIRAAAARISGSFCTETSSSLRSMVVLLAMMVTSRRRVVRRSMYGEDFVQRGNCRVHMGAFQNVRRQETQHSVTGAVDEDAALEHFSNGELRKLRRIEFRGNHQALPAYIDYGFVPSGEQAQALHKVTADLSRTRQQAVHLDRVNDGDADCASQRAAAEGGAVHARVHHTRNLLGAQHRSQRKATCKRLGECGHIGLNAIVLIRAPFSRAAHAGLNLIDDKQSASGVGQGACFAEKLLG